MLQPQFFFLSPVQVVKVTKENLNEVAEWCGGTVLETPSRRDPKVLDKYVHVPTPEGSAISWAFPNMYITRRLVVTGKGDMKTSFAVFKRDYFEKNYFVDPSDAVAMTWEAQAAENRNKRRDEIAVKTHVGDVLREALLKVQQAGVVSQEQANAILDEAIPAGEAPMPIPSDQAKMILEGLGAPAETPAESTAGHR